MTEWDIPWLLELSHRRYPRYDEVETEKWFRNTCLKSALLFHPMRSDNAFCITMLTLLPWFPNDWEAHIVFICADHGCSWEAVRLVRASVDWSRKRKATWWRCCSETEFDLGPLARRVGAKEVSPRFALRL